MAVAARVKMVDADNGRIELLDLHLLLKERPEAVLIRLQVDTKAGAMMGLRDYPHFVSNLASRTSHFAFRYVPSRPTSYLW